MFLFFKFLTHSLLKYIHYVTYFIFTSTLSLLAPASLSTWHLWYLVFMRQIPAYISICISHLLDISYNLFILKFHMYKYENCEEKQHTQHFKPLLSFSDDAFCKPGINIVNFQILPTQYMQPCFVVKPLSTKSITSAYVYQVTYFTHCLFRQVTSQMLNFLGIRYVFFVKKCPK